MKQELMLFGILTLGASAFAQTALPKIYVEPQGGFESYLAAAIVKKRVAAVVTQDKENAQLVLTSVVLAKEESTGSKVARCLFAYCAGIQGTQTATVQLVNANSKEVVWAYNVLKGSANAYQSTSEAVAKHLKKYLDDHPFRESEVPSRPPTIASANTSLLTPPPPPAPPAEIRMGMTTTEVQSALGLPEKTTKFGDKEIQTFGSIKITFLEGKVTNVE